MLVVVAVAVVAVVVVATGLTYHPKDHPQVQATSHLEVDLVEVGATTIIGNLSLLPLRASLVQTITVIGKSLSVVTCALPPTDHRSACAGSPGVSIPTAPSRSSRYPVQGGNLSTPSWDMPS